VTRLALLAVLISCHSSTGAPAAVDASPASPDAATRLCAIGSGGPGCGAGQFCGAFEVGIAPMTGTCMALPAACIGTPTCACMAMNFSCGGMQCTGSGEDLGVVCLGI
jgi:hypothetical protein